MNLHNSQICEDQRQALSTYLESLLSGPEMSMLVPAAAPIPATAPAIEAPKLVADSGAGARIKCFVFAVAGLKLALPLARVTEIVDFSECRGAAAGLLLGELVHEGRSVPVLDSARILLPDRNVTPSYQWLVIIDHGSYALACDSVEPNMDVAYDAVCWRTHFTKRRWLAGTLLQQRCALLDADEIYDQSADNSLRN